MRLAGRATSTRGAFMERIDSHQHFWIYNTEQYGWITPEKSALRRDFLPADLQPLLATTGFDGSIAVQARQCIEETDWLLEISKQHNFVKGVVGWVDLRADDLEKQLGKYARETKLVGVRHVVHDEPDDRFILRPKFRRGIALLGQFNLTYDLLLFPRHLPAAIRLAEEFPKQRFILDHIAKPAIGSREQPVWQQGIEMLADLTNVSCKVSGMVTEARRSKWRGEDFYPYLDVVTEAFGPDRLMIGSDWPVCTLAGSYAGVMDVVTSYVERLPAKAREGVLGGNCARIYRLGGGRRP